MEFLFDTIPNTSTKKCRALNAIVKIRVDAIYVRLHMQMLIFRLLIQAALPIF